MKIANKPTADSVWREYEKMLDYNASIQLDDTVRVNENFFVGKQWAVSYTHLDVYKRQT